MGSPGPLAEVMNVESGFEICSDWSAGAGARAFFVTFVNLDNGALEQFGGSITLTEVIYETSEGDAHVEVVLAAVDSELGGDASPMSWFYDDRLTVHDRLKAIPLPVAIEAGAGAGVRTVGAIIETDVGAEALVDLRTRSLRYPVGGRDYELPLEHRIRLLEDRFGCS